MIKNTFRRQSHEIIYLCANWTDRISITRKMRLFLSNIKPEFSLVTPVFVIQPCHAGVVSLTQIVVILSKITLKLAVFLSSLSKTLCDGLLGILSITFFFLHSWQHVPGFKMHPLLPCCCHSSPFTQRLTWVWHWHTPKAVMFSFFYIFFSSWCWNNKGGI